MSEVEFSELTQEQKNEMFRIGLVTLADAFAKLAEPVCIKNGKISAWSKEFAKAFGVDISYRERVRRYGKEAEYDVIMKQTVTTACDCVVADMLKDGWRCTCGANVDGK